ncbi:unnamed protein product, partial [Ectocarpus sp. 12 AP-2014]
MDSATGSRPVTDVKTSEPDTDDELPLPDLDESAEGDDEPTPDQADDELQASDLSHMDPELIGIFLEEAYDLINSTGSALHTWSEDPSNRDVAAELQRDVHTLKGGARMAGVDAIGDLTHVLEDLFEKVAEGQLDASDAMNDLLFACHDRLAQMVEQVATQRPCPPADELVMQVKAILAGESLAEEDLTETAEPAEARPEPADSDDFDLSPGMAEAIPEATDDELIGIFLDEGLEIQGAISECLAQWREEPDELTGVTKLQQELHT